MKIGHNIEIITAQKFSSKTVA